MDDEANQASDAPETEADDVETNTAEQTADTASGEEKEVQEETSSSEEVPLEDKPVPYSRFKQLLEENKQLKQAGQQQPDVAQEQPVNPTVENIRQQLKSLGFVDKAEVDKELSRLREDTKVEQQLDVMSGKYDGKDGRPKFNRTKVLEYAINNQIGDLETAYKAINEKALIDWHIKRATSKTGAVKTERSDGTGSAKAGVTDDDLKEAVKGGDKSALSAYLKRRVRSAQKK